MKHMPMAVLMFLVLVVTFSFSTTVVLGQQMSMDQGMSSMSDMAMTQMMYDIMVEAESFTEVFKVMVMSNGDLPKSVQFNQDQRTIAFVGSGLTTKDLHHYEVTIPDVLLGGNFTVTVDGKPIESITVPNETNSTIHIDIRSSYVKENSLGDSAIITLAGTTVIPEFPFAMLILASTVGFIIIITRKKLINSKVHFFQNNS